MSHSSSKTEDISKDEDFKSKEEDLPLPKTMCQPSQRPAQYDEANLMEEKRIPESSASPFKVDKDSIVESQIRSDITRFQMSDENEESPVMEVARDIERPPVYTSSEGDLFVLNKNSIDFDEVREFANEFVEELGQKAAEKAESIVGSIGSLHGSRDELIENSPRGEDKRINF